MALFGNDMTEVTTPDGRQIKLPAQLAAQFPELRPVTPAAAAIAMPDQGGGMAPGMPAPLPVAPPTPAFAPGELAPPPQPTPMAQPQPQVSPPAPESLAAKPVTNAELAKQGNAGAYNAEAAAADERKRAIERQAEVEATEAAEVGRKSEEISARSEELLAASAKQATDNAAELDRRLAAYDQEAKAIRDTKIDRSVDHPILAAIGVALGGLGAAMARKDGNPALDALYKAIDRKVAGQMQDLEGRRGNLAMSKEQLGMKRQAQLDGTAEADKYRLAYLDNAQRDILAIKAKSGSERVRAAADMAAAGIETEKAKTRGEYAAREQAKIEREQVRKDQKSQFYAGLSQSDRHFNKSFDENKRQFDVREANDLEQARLAAAAKGKGKAFGELDEEARKFAIGDPSSGEWLLQPEGMSMLKEAEGISAKAEKIRAAAANEKDPAKRAALEQASAMHEQRASEIRGAARTLHPFKVGDLGDRAKVATMIASSQTIAGAVDRIKELRKKHGARWLRTTDGEAAMQSMGVSLTMAFKDAWQLGVLSASDIDLLNKATGGDPSKLTLGDISNLLGAEGPVSRLDELTEAVEKKVRHEMGSRGFRGEWKLQKGKNSTLTPSQEATTEAFQGATPTEEANKQRPGIAGRALDAVRPSNFANALYGGDVDPQIRRENEAAAAGSARYPGLNAEQAGAVDLNLRTYQQNVGLDSPVARKRAENAEQALLALAVDPRDEGGKRRGSVSTAVLAALEQGAPDLHRRAVAALPKPVVEERSQSEQVVMSVQPIGLLTETAIAGDPASRAEIVRRIAAGDKDAARAATEIVNAKGRPKFAPVGAR